MKAAISLGFSIGLACAGAWAADMPAGAPAAADTVGAGAPMPLTPAVLPPSAGAPPVAPVQPPRSLRFAARTQYPITAYNPYHPHWIVQVFGR